MNIIENQKRLMGLVDEGSYTISHQTPVVLLQKINELKIHAQNVAHFSEMATRAFRKIAEQLKDFEEKALESPEILNGQTKTLMNNVRIATSNIDNSQDRANQLLKSIDFLMTNSNSWISTDLQ